MIAALPMYDWPELRAETDQFWSALRDALRVHGVDAPDALTRDRASRAVWSDPDLLFSQTCGWPYVTEVSQWAQLVATPVYAAPGCEGPRYSSALVARAGAPLQRAEEAQRIAINSLDSLSGWRAVAGQLPNGIAKTETGSHRASLAAVAAGEADLAAIDALCWAYSAEIAPDLHAELRVIGWTPKLPALPFITARNAAPEMVGALRAALSATLREPDLQPALTRLRLTGAAVLSDADYAPIAQL